MKDDDGCNVNNMNSQNLKEGDCDDLNKDDNKECLFNNIAASDQYSENNSSKNSEVSEYDSGVASSQDSLCQVNISSDKTKLSHSYFNSRTGTSFIHINSINRPVVRNNQTNTYFEKEWEILKKKMMKPSIVSSVCMKQSSESLEEQKKDISFIDEPEALNLPNLHNVTLNKHKNEDNTDTESNKNSDSFLNYSLSKESIYKTSHMSKSQSENTISKELRNHPICSLASSFYEPISCNEDYIGSSFTKTFLNYSAATTNQNSSNTTPKTSIDTTKLPPPSSVILKPLSSIRTSLSHSTTEIVSCTYSPVSSSSLFNSSNHNPFKTHSYRDEFLSLDPNYSTKHTTPIFQPSTNSTGIPVVSSDLHHTLPPPPSSTHTLPSSCFSPLSKNHHDAVNRIPEEIELGTFTSSQNHNYNNSNVDNHHNDKSLTFKELSSYRETATSTKTNSTTATPTTVSVLLPVNSSPLIEGDVSSKSVKYQEMQRRRQRNKKTQNPISTTTLDKVPDYVGSKSLEEIIEFICSNENKGTLEKNQKKSKKKPTGNSVGKEGSTNSQSCDKNEASQKGKDVKSKTCHNQVLQNAEGKMINGENEETMVMSLMENEDDKIKKEIVSSKEHELSSKASTEVMEKQEIKSQKLDTVNTDVNTCKGMGLEAVDDFVVRTESSINSLDHIDKFTNVMPLFKNHHNKETTPDIDHKPPPILSLQLPTKTNTIIFNNCDIELDSKLIFTDDIPKTGTFSVVTKRKKIKSKHHSSDNQDLNFKSNVMSSSLNNHLPVEKPFLNNKTRFNGPQSKPTRETNSAKAKSKNLEAPKVSSLPLQSAKNDKLFTSNSKNTSNQSSTEVKAIVRPISSPQLQATTLNQPTTTHIPSQPISTKTNVSNPISNQPTYSSKLKNSQTNEATKTTHYSSKTTQSIINKQPPTSGNNFFLDTKHLVKPQKNADFMFGYDGDLPHEIHTKTTNIPPTISTESDKKTNSKIVSEIVEENGCERLEGGFSDDNSRDKVISSLTFVNNSIVNITSEQTNNPNSNQILSPLSPLSTSTNPSSTQPIHHHNSRENLSDNISPFENNDARFDCPAQIRAHHHSISPPQLPPQHPLQQHPLQRHHLPNQHSFQQIHSPQNQQLSPQHILSPQQHLQQNISPQQHLQQNISPQQHLQQHLSPQQHPPFCPISQWYMPFNIPMMVLPTNNPSNPHHNPNNPSNNPYNFNNNPIANQNNPNINPNYPTNNISNNNIPNTYYPNHFTPMQSTHHHHHPFHHRLPRPPHSKNHRNHRDFHSHPSFRQKNIKYKDTNSNIEHSRIESSEIENSRTEKSRSEKSRTENLSTDSVRKIRKPHSTNVTSSSSSSPVSSPHNKSPPLSPSMATQSISSNKSHFDLTKAQNYLDSTFKEVINSKDVIVHPPTG